MVQGQALCTHSKPKLLCGICKKEVLIEKAANATGKGDSMTFDEMLDHCDIEELFHITPIENLPSIQEKGLLPREALQDRGTSFGDISMAGPQKTRRAKGLHDKVPLYYNARNPMMYKRKDRIGDLCVLGINPNILKREDVIITTGNAAASRTQSREYTGWWNLRKVDWKVVWANRWTDYDDGARKRCAEALVPNSVTPGHIDTVYVGSRKATRKVNEMETPWRPIQRRDLFFAGRR